ncbi:MAG: PstA family ABC transporter permease [Verrucomicrobiales bacterium]|nr:PstA family ABC transporter permease [Verrucomicrobiales bacterium]
MNEFSDNQILNKERPFAPQTQKRRQTDTAVSWVFRLATYGILACAAYIFGDIIVKGAPVVFRAEAPFINVEFFTRSPETLVVFETQDGTERQLAFSDYSQWKKDNPGVEIAKEHTHSYSGGGILGPLVGTALLTIICIVIALLIGQATAIFLNEYSSKGRFINVIRLAIMNLAGVPSVVFGLFGLGLFCLFFPVITTASELRVEGWRAIQLFGTEKYLAFQGWGTCMLAGGCTLAVMVLPVIITACEESLKAIPMGFREASLALGATKWQTIRTSVLPYAFPGMLTASVLGITRVAGETAPIMFTAALAHKDKLPWQGLAVNPESGFFGRMLSQVFGFFTESVQAMPYHIYTVAARIPQSEYTRPMQYGSVFVFMVLVMCLSALSVFLRIHYRKKMKW